MSQETGGLNGGTGFAGDDEENAAVGIDDTSHGIGSRAVQHGQRRKAQSWAEHTPEHLRRQAGATHPTQHHSIALFADSVGELLEIRVLFQDALRHFEPAQSVRQLSGGRRRTPHSRVLRPDTLHNRLGSHGTQPFLDGRVEFSERSRSNVRVDRYPLPPEECSCAFDYSFRRESEVREQILDWGRLSKALHAHDVAAISNPAIPRHRVRSFDCQLRNT